MESIKKLWKNKKIQWAVFIFLGILCILYLRIFFTEGYTYRETFLKKQKEEQGFSYIGSFQGKKLHIVVLPKDKEIEVSYLYEKGPFYQYRIVFPKGENMGRKAVQFYRVEEQGITLDFEGTVSENFEMLFHKDGEIASFDYEILFTDQQMDLTRWQKRPKWISILRVGTEREDGVRGKAEPFILGIFLLAYWVLDMKWPRFFFYLSHWIDVKDPEPSDFYLGIQKAGWILLPVVILILFLAAVF